MWGRVIVCDDHSPLQTELHNVLDRFKVKKMVLKERGNYSKMVNQGTKVVKSLGGSGIITVNNDIEHKTKFLDHLDELCEVDPLIQVIGPQLYYPDGKTQHGGVEVISAHNYCRDVARGEYLCLMPSRFCHHVTGAWQFIKLDGLDRRYDERFNFGFEDVEFTMRLWEDGKRSFFTNKVSHIHHESASRGKIMGKKELENTKLFQEQTFDFKKINDYIDEANATTSLLLGSDRPLLQREHCLRESQT